MHLLGDHATCSQPLSIISQYSPKVFPWFPLVFHWSFKGLARLLKLLRSGWKTVGYIELSLWMHWNTVSVGNCWVLNVSGPSENLIVIMTMNTCTRMSLKECRKTLEMVEGSLKDYKFWVAELSISDDMFLCKRGVTSV